MHTRNDSHKAPGKTTQQATHDTHQPLRRHLLLWPAAAALASHGLAGAQPAAWPTRPVKMTVAFAAGGTVDLVTRYLADQLSQALPQPFVVENRPGAGGNLATELVVRAPADGYTFLVSGSPTHSVNPHLYRNLPYDPIADTTAIALVGSAPNLLIVNPNVAANTVGELAALARAKPGQLSFSSAGNGTSGHLAGELFRRLAKVDIQHVPYKGQADAITAVIRGDVAMAFVTVAGTLQQVQAGRLRAIGITSLERSALAPDIPTVAQSGFPEFEVLAWYSISAPKGLPADITARMVREVERIMALPATAEKFRMLGADPTYMSGAAFMDFMRRDSAKWGRVIREAGITTG